jgi:hypothetical protein
LARYGQHTIPTRVSAKAVDENVAMQDLSISRQSDNTATVQLAASVPSLAPINHDSSGTKKVHSENWGDEGKQELYIRFPCPIYPFAPEDHTYCSNSSWINMSDVVSHLKASPDHKLPLYCPKCYKTFNRQDSAGSRSHKDENLCDLDLEDLEWHGVDATLWQDFERNFEDLETPDDTREAIHKKLIPNSRIPSIRSTYRPPIVEEE